MKPSFLSNPLRPVSLGMVAIALLFPLAGAGPASAQPLGTLENPTNQSFHSGIGVISGWVCDADTVTVTIDGTQVLTAAYGTPRADSMNACGDTNNGFGLLWNFNNFGAGTHTISAAADGVPFGELATFTVTKLGEQAFIRGLSGSFQRSGFPAAGNSFNLLWQEGSQNFVIAPPGTPATATAAASSSTGSARSGLEGTAGAVTGALENPGPFVSGIWLFSGWVCDARRVTVLIDGAQRLRAAYGTPRGDTQGACGDTNNGFGLLWNFNNFGEGSHTVEAFADGMSIGGPRSFVVTGFGVPFLRGANRTFRLPGFPNASMDTFVRWQEANQNFVIRRTELAPGVSPTPAPTATPVGGVTPTPRVTPTGGGGPTPIRTPTPGGPTPIQSPTPIRTPTPVQPTPVQTPTPSGGGVCGNDLIETGEMCEGSNLNGFTCEIAYLAAPDDPTTVCQGEPLACDDDCSFNGENSDACVCTCDEDIDCLFPDDPDDGGRPVGIDCTLYWCDKGNCPCDHLASPEEFTECIDDILFPEDGEEDPRADACERFSDCVDDTSCFIGDVNAVYDFFTTTFGVCGFSSNGVCDTDLSIFQDDAIKRALCTSFEEGGLGAHRCTQYCDDAECDCSDPNNLRSYNVDEGTCD